MTKLPILHDAGAYSFFLDFDGTLTEIAETPSAVVVEHRTRQALKTLFQASSGAVAIVTGREIEAIDAFLSPMKFPVAGVHGYERRNGSATVTTAASEDAAAEAAVSILRAFAGHNAGVLLERKRGAVALHYRLRPELETLCLGLVEDTTSHLSNVVLTRGKMVIEARFHSATKGTAIREFLHEPPFLGRVPCFAGDDVTDEDAFTAVNALGGISIKVGPGESAARLRVGTVDEFLAWLTMTAESLQGNY